MAMTGAELRARLRVAPDRTLDLDGWDTDETFGFDKVSAKVRLAETTQRLTDLQDRLWAEDQHRVLVVLQGIDTAGKGGTIKHVMGAFVPQGCSVASFKVPTPEERAHDFLWRIHKHVPGNGEVAIFDRSHYEDVLIVRVHELVPKAVWSRRYEQINAFERLLADEGTTILKFFLHISKDEQRERLQARLDDPAKRWKFRRGDIEERKHWSDYLAAYEDALSRCSTDWAPWYVIPADRKWCRNLLVSEILAATLDDLDPQYPPPAEDIAPGLVIT